MSYVVLYYLILSAITCLNARNCYNVICKIDLDLSCMRSYEQRGCYLKLSQYLYCLHTMSPDVTDILSRMQNVFLKSVRLVGVVICLCTWFYDCSRLCPISPVYDPSCCCYLQSVVLVINGLVSRLSQTSFDWSTVT